MVKAKELQGKLGTAGVQAQAAESVATEDFVKRHRGYAE